jgi:DNA (cytosine-5)-methyltransferase 1
MNCLELFAGCGGAALGIERAGFYHVGLVEWSADACATMRAAGLVNVVEGDVNDMATIRATVAGVDADLVWSSFPCQAWSMAGDRKGAQDDRNGWPGTMAAIREINPRAFIGENVRGILYHSQSSCGDPLTCPGCYSDRVICEELGEVFPHVRILIINAADYGLAQHRVRVFFVGTHAPIHAPSATHSKGGGLYTRPWRSIGDALGLNVADTSPSYSVTATEFKGATPKRNNRASDSLALCSDRRRLTVEECALLQDFPIGYPFQGSKRSQYRQIGNAVPPRMARVVAGVVMESIKNGGLCVE